MATSIEPASWDMARFKPAIDHELKIITAKPFGWSTLPTSRSLTEKSEGIGLSILWTFFLLVRVIDFLVHQLTF